MLSIRVRDLLRGHADLETSADGLRPHRLVRAVRERFPDPQLMMAEAQPSGVRVAFASAAQSVELDLHATRYTHKGFHRPRGHVDLVVDGVVVERVPLAAGDLTEIDPATGAVEFHRGETETIRFTGLASIDKRIELFLPHNESVEIGELRTDAPVTPVPDRARWVHHGSSISQGSNAASPTQTWPVVAALAGGVDLVNLGFGGSAMVDPFVARQIRDQPADLISLKFGINVVNLDAMRRRIFVPLIHGFLDTVRDGHPATPLVLISPIFCGIHEDTPGPGGFDPASFGTGQVRFIATGQTGDTALGRLTLTVIRAALAEVVDVRDDPHLHLLDGTTLYGAADAAELPLPDGLHPDTETHQLIGSRLAAWAFGENGLVTGAR